MKSFMEDEFDAEIEQAEQILNNVVPDDDETYMQETQRIFKEMGGSNE